MTNSIDLSTNDKQYRLMDKTRKMDLDVLRKQETDKVKGHLQLAFPG